VKTLIIIPTYNEKENIMAILEAVLALPIGVDILVVDDNSPDGTADLVKTKMQTEKRVHLLSRAGKQGLGKAYLAGFDWGLKEGFKILVEMDADFSHRPQDLVKLLEKIKDADFAVGSRYISGGQTVNWGLLRKIISRGGGIYSRLILGFPLNDWTGGFNAWKDYVLKDMNLSTVKSNGYSFQIELKYKALKLGFKGVESPIVFEDRRVGNSKMSFKIVIEAFWRVWIMRWNS
jgi:dolichol-phosphate mannosyltransferase